MGVVAGRAVHDFGFALKPLMIVLMLLAVVLYPALRGECCWPWLQLAAAPLLAHAPSMPGNSPPVFCKCSTTRSLRGPTEQFPHLFWVLRTAGAEIPPAAQTALRLLASASPWPFVG